jgi:hypothetical protein
MSDYGKEKEIEYLKQEIDLLLENRAKLALELPISGGGQSEFALKKRIEDLDKKIADRRQKLAQLQGSTYTQAPLASEQKQQNTEGAEQNVTNITLNQQGAKIGVVVNGDAVFNGGINFGE